MVQPFKMALILFRHGQKHPLQDLKSISRFLIPTFQTPNAVDYNLISLNHNQFFSFRVYIYFPDPPNLNPDLIHLNGL